MSNAEKGNQRGSVTRHPPHPAEYPAMPGWWVPAFAAAILALLCFAAPAAAAQPGDFHHHGVLHSASELDYPPFALVRKDGSADGFSVELLRAVVNAVGFRVQFSVGPWHEIKQRLIAGDLDLLPLVSHSPVRDRVLDFSAPYLRLHGTIFVRKGERSIRSEADLKGREVIVMQGDNAHEYALAHRLTEKLVLTESYADALTLLASGRHDAVLMLQLVGFQLLAKHGITNVVSIHTVSEMSLKPASGPLSGYEQKFCFAVPEGRKELLAYLNEGLAIVIANGTYNALYQKWFGPILPPPQPSWTKILTCLLYILVPLVGLGAGAGIWYLNRQVAIKTSHLRDEVRERQQVERVLQESEQKFRTLFHATAIPLCWVDDRGVIRDFNKRFTQVFGYTRADIPTLAEWWVLAYPDPAYRQWVVATWDAAVAEARKADTDIRSEAYRVTCKNGEVRHVIISGTTFQTHFLATFIDITDHTLAEERFETAFALISDILCIADLNGYFRLINPAAREILGYSEAELLSKPFIEFVHPADREKTQRIVDEKLKQGEHVLHFSNRYICKDGSIKWLEWTSHPMPEQGITYAAARDCTERLQMQESLKKSLADLERSNRELQQFAYVASHDLQEPLRTSVGFLQLLQTRYQDQLDEKGAHYIARAVKAGHRMQDLIQDLLTLSRVNTQANPPGLTDLNRLMTDTLELLHPLVSEKGATIEVSPLPTLVVDDSQIQSLFQNLIVNGLKYNKNPQPAIRIGCRKGTDETLFHVRDNGIGIPPAFQERIFMPFQRLHSRRDYGGSGIGLAICKKIVERHGGRIWVEAEPEKGSTFFFTLAHGRIRHDFG